MCKRSAETIAGVHHDVSMGSDENIMRDIRAGIVYLLISDEGIPAGTVTLTNNEIDRLFVLPSFQRRGYGKSLMDMAEEKYLLLMM